MTVNNRKIQAFSPPITMTLTAGRGLRQMGGALFVSLSDFQRDFPSMAAESLTSLDPLRGLRLVGSKIHSDKHQSLARHRQSRKPAQA